MRALGWVALGLLAIASQAHGQSTGIICDQSQPGQTYLGVLENNAIDPIAKTINQRISPFASARFVNLTRIEATSDNHVGYVVETLSGHISGQADGDNVALALGLENIKLESDMQGGQNVSKQIRVDLRIVVSPLGEVKSASASGAGIDRSSPIAKRILSEFRAAYGDSGKLPENGIRQDESIATSSNLAGMLKLLKLTARGVGIYQHRLVVAFAAVGDVLRIQDSKLLGHLEGYQLLDRATGMWVRSETDGSLEVNSTGQPIEMKTHSCNEIRF